MVPSPIWRSCCRDSALPETAPLHSVRNRQGESESVWVHASPRGLEAVHSQTRQEPHDLLRIHCISVLSRFPSKGVVFRI